MDQYQVFNGLIWVDICECDVNIKTTSQWTLLDPWNCPTSYWDGSVWCPIICCECPPGYQIDPITKDCFIITQSPAIASGGTAFNIIAPERSTAYSAFGSRLYENISAKIFPLNGWQNTAISVSSPTAYQVFDNAGTGALTLITATSAPANAVFSNTPVSNNRGRLNEARIWATGFPANEWLSIEFCITIEEERPYIFALAGDNQVKADITSSTFNGGVTNLNLINLWAASNPAGTAPSSTLNPFKLWHMFPITLPAGVHTLQLSGMEFTTPSAFGAEIYDISSANITLLMANTALTIAMLQPFILFSTRNLVTTPPLAVSSANSPVTWTCPDGSTLTGCFGVPICQDIEHVPCTPPLLCNIYSQIVIFSHGSSAYNRVTFLCDKIPTYSCQGTSGIGAFDMASLIILLNTPGFCLSNLGVFYDNGDGRVRLELLIGNVLRCDCLLLEMVISEF